MRAHGAAPAIQRRKRRSDCDDLINHRALPPPTVAERAASVNGTFVLVSGLPSVWRGAKSAFLHGTAAQEGERARSGGCHDLALSFGERVESLSQAGQGLLALEPLVGRPRRKLQLHLLADPPRSLACAGCAPSSASTTSRPGNVAAPASTGSSSKSRQSMEGLAKRLPRPGDGSASTKTYCTDTASRYRHVSVNQ